MEVTRSYRLWRSRRRFRREGEGQLEALPRCPTRAGRELPSADAPVPGCLVKLTSLSPWRDISTAPSSQLQLQRPASFPCGLGNGTHSGERGDQFFPLMGFNWPVLPLTHPPFLMEYS